MNNINSCQQIAVCMSPLLLGLHPLPNTIVVVVDVLRATSTIAAALHAGVQAIVPVATTHEAQQLQAQGYLAAAERNGKTVAGFDLGNSPLEFMQPHLYQKTIALTTTNGTKCIAQSHAAAQIICGAFVNIDAVADYLHTQPHDVIVLCAGWKDTPSLEDCLFAGALTQKMTDNYNAQPADDAALMCVELYKKAQGNLINYMKQSGHYKRLQQHGTDDDLIYCTMLNNAPVVPILKNKQLIKL